MPEMLKTVSGSHLGLSPDNDLLVRDLATGANHYAPTSADISKIVKLTQVEYDALDPVVSTTLYVIVG